MPNKAAIVPPLGHRWVDPLRRAKAWGRRLVTHGGTATITIPMEIRRMLNWECGDVVILTVVGDEMRVHRPAVRELEHGEVRR